MACWHFGCLGLGRGQGEGHEQQAPHCPSLCLFLPSLSCSLLQFPRCPGYLCGGNCARLPAQTQIPPLVSLFASMMTQQLLQGFQPPPSSTSVIHHAHQTE
ncbi:activin receptor type-1 isoform X1 [Lates japonicus]|uniref:Activin receptor type-1 isoform X1 n=1 Tax=Lates japonicus TaxID=270547 RepID=A0AAD3QX79_LATJO|nr:activin receptor type-1 isoform X1 [Lates japonicus]